MSTLPTSVAYSEGCPPVCRHAARLLAAHFGLPSPSASSEPTTGTLAVYTATSGWPVPEGAGDGEGAWIQLGKSGGVLYAPTPAHLYAGARALVSGALDDEALERGVHLAPAFPFHRPLYDQALTQVARSVRDFEPEAYVAALAAAGFTHLEVNGLQAHVPYEPGVATEFYRDFYTYCPGLNHFVDTKLTRGIYPASYLQANLNRVKRLSELAREYGLKPGLLCFEPRSLPEAFFQRYPTLRGARIDHPLRSHLPRYTLAQDHPVAQEHYRGLMRAMMRAVPDLSYLSVWTNDSGAGFEHTGSLYVGRNGGPYMIREWRSHEQIAQRAGEAVLEWLRLMQGAAAETNPDFLVSLRVEHFKTEHDVIFEGLGDGLTVEAPSMLVRGYDLPYKHPEYPDQVSGYAGSIHQFTLDEREAGLAAQHRANGFEPSLHYAPSSGFNLEPLLGTPFPRMLHAKLTAMREAGLRGANALGGLMHVEKTPYWPNPAVIHAAQYLPDASADDVLQREATRHVGREHAGALVEAWDALEEGVRFMPTVPLYSNLGFVWYRTWIRPLIPNLEAVPEDDRLYYERFMVTVYNNPNNTDLALDVLFELITEESGRYMTAAFDDNALPRLARALEQIEAKAGETEGTDAHAAFADLRDRATALLCWATTNRNTCAWVAHVHGYLGAETDAEREEHSANIQAMIDLDLENTRRLLDLWETSETEFMLVSGVGETPFMYGENLGENLRRKIDLTERYRHATPYIDDAVQWRVR